MRPLDMSRVTARVADASGTLLVATVRDHHLVNSALARIVVDFNTQPESQTAALAAINKALAGKARAVADSFRVASTEVLAMSGFVTPNREHRRIKSSELSKFQVIAKNVLMSNEDNTVWDLNQDGENIFITRQQEENLSELMELATVRERGMPSARVVKANVQAGEYVAFACDRTQSTRYGFVAKAGADSTLVVVARDTQDVAYIEESQVIEIATLDRKKDAVLAAVSHVVPDQEDPSLRDLTTYYQAVYGYDPAYWAKFEDVIRQRGY